MPRAHLWWPTRSRLVGARVERHFRAGGAAAIDDADSRVATLAICHTNRRRGCGGWWGCEVDATFEHQTRTIRRRTPIPPAILRAFEDD